MNQATARRALAPRRRLALEIALWTVSVLLAALFVTAGGAKFIGSMNEQFLAWGYTRDFAVMIGILEMLGAVGLLVKRTAGWAAVGLMVLMLGAVWTLAVHHEYIAMITPIVVLAALTFVAWGRGLTWETRAAAPEGEVVQP